MQWSILGENGELRDIVEGLISEIRVIGRGKWFNNYFLFCNVDYYSIKLMKIVNVYQPGQEILKTIKKHK